MQQTGTDTHTRREPDTQGHTDKGERHTKTHRKKRRDRQAPTHIDKHETYLHRQTDTELSIMCCLNVHKHLNQIKFYQQCAMHIFYIVTFSFVFSQ